MTAADATQVQRWKIAERNQPSFTWAVMALSRSGDQLLQRTFGDDPWSALAELGVRTDEDSVETLPMSAAGPGSASNGAINDRWVLWSQTPEGRIDVDPWSLVVHERGSSSSMVVMEAPAMQNGDPPPAPPGYDQTALVGDWAYWTVVSGSTKRLRVDLWGCDLRACEPARVHRNAALPATDGTSLWFVDWPPVAMGADSTEAKLMRAEPGSGEAAVVADLGSGGPTGLAVSRRAAVVTHGDRVQLVDLGSGEVRVVTAGWEGTYGYPSAGDDFVVFSEDSGDGEPQVAAFVLTSSGRMFTIGNSSGLYGTAAAGRLLEFRQRNSGALENVIVRVK